MGTAPVGASTLPKMVAKLKADPLGWYKANKLEPPTWLEEAARARASGHPHEGSQPGMEHGHQG